MGQENSTPVSAPPSEKAEYFNFGCDLCGSRIVHSDPRLHCTTCSTTVMHNKMFRTSFDLCMTCWEQDTNHRDHVTKIRDPSSAVPIRDNDRLAEMVWLYISGCDGPCLKERDGPWLEYPEVALQSRALQTYWLRSNIPTASMALIFLDNSPKWLIADFACIFAGFISVPVATTTSASQLAAILKRTQVTVAVCGSHHVALLAGALREVGQTLDNLVVVENSEDSDGSESRSVFAELCPIVACWSEVTQLKGGLAPIQASKNPEDYATLIFSSGSTGVPKATIFTDACLLREWSGMSMLPVYIFAYEPMCYSTQRLLSYDALRSGGYVVFFSGDMSHFFEELRDAAPSNFSGPPRLWNMLYAIYKAKVVQYTEEGRKERREKMDREGAEEGEGAKEGEEEEGKEESKRIEEETVEDDKGGRVGGNEDSEETIVARAEARAQEEISGVFGNNILSISTGGAPTSPEVWKWMQRCFKKVRISEGYGATEVGTIASNGVRRHSCRVHLDDVPELNYWSHTKPARGLLWVRTLRMTPGYFNDKENTEENFKVRDDLDGEIWYNTGDIVEYNSETEELRVIDRHKNIVKLAQSVFVSPEHLENVFIVSPFVENIFIYAESTFEHVVAVVLPNRDVFFDTAKKFGIQLPGSEEQENLEFLCRHEKIIYEVLESLKETGRKAELLPHEIPAKILLEPVRWSIENNLLTVSFKLARASLRLYYRDTLRRLYGVREGEDGTVEGKEEGAGRDAGEGSAGTAGAPEKSTLEKILGDFLPCSIDVCKERKLSELGIDSISILQLSAILSSHFGGFETSVLFSKTIGELLESDSKILIESEKVSFDDDLVLDASFDKFTGTEFTEQTIREIFTIFVTGVTGFVGSHVLYFCLKNYLTSQVVCLVRSQGEKRGWERLKRTLEYFKLEISESEFQRIRVIEGSLGVPFFGIPEEEFQELANGIDFIVHSGCWVNGVLSYSALRKSNVLGTKECLRLARACPKLKKMCHVSSLSVSAFHPGSKLRETDFPRVSGSALSSKRNGYGLSKCVSEILVTEAFKRGLPGCIVRPGTICGGEVGGRGSPHDFISKYFKAIVQMGRAPKISEHVISMVSVDFVSNLCLTATLAPPSPEPSGTIPVYHCLGSAPENSFSVGAITCLAREAGHQIEEMEYSGWLGYLFRQTDHKTCALVPLKSYFQGGFPGTSDYDTASDEHTLSFVTHYNTSIASSPSSSLGSSLPGLPMYRLSPDIVRSFFSPENINALED
jgi:fatty acid CoA ligase FadD9